MKMNLIHNLLKTNFSIGFENKEGKEYLIIPIVALVEGVHSGSGGAAFYPSEEIKKTTKAWNGVPLTIGHPSIEGKFVSVNEVESQKWVVGSFRNVEYKNGKLVGEGWIVKEDLIRLSPDTLSMLSVRKNIEVSTGLYTNTDEVEGEWNGEEYKESLFNFSPDHLALLPESVGACSFSDGCGVRANIKSCKFYKEKGGEGVEKEEIQEYKILVNEISQEKIRDKLIEKVNGMDTPNVVHYLKAVYSNYFIFEKSKLDTNETSMFKMEYSVNKDIVTIQGDPKEVIEKVKYVPKENIFNKKTGGVKMNKREDVQALISNEKLQFTEEDSKWLEELEENHFAKLFALNSCGCGENAENVEEIQKIKRENEGLKKEMEILKTNAQKEGEKEVTYEDVMAKAPAEVREMITNGINIMKEKKKYVVDSILKNEKNKLSEMYLNSQPIEVLEGILAISVNKSTYVGNTPPVDNFDRKTDGYGVPEVPTMKWNKDGTPNFSEI